MKTIAEALAHYPRVELTRTPTPLDFLAHVSEKLGTNLYIKRDDLTDLTLGGDKPRKLEYELGKIKDAGFDTLVTCGSSQSNNARLTTAAARKLGMDCVVVLNRDEWQVFQGNLLTVYLMGAQVHVIDATDHWALDGHVQGIMEQLQRAGKKPHYIPVSGTTPHSVLGYVRCGLEIIGQLEHQKVQLDAVYAPFGTGGIFAAILMTLRESGIDCPVIGISVNRDHGACLEQFELRWAGLCDLLERDPDRERGDFEIHDGFRGGEYGVLTDAALDAIMLMGESEGILLDPVYSGKVFSGLIAPPTTGTLA